VILDTSIIPMLKREFDLFIECWIWFNAILLKKKNWLHEKQNLNGKGKKWVEHGRASKSAKKNQLKIC